MALHQMNMLGTGHTLIAQSSCLRGFLSWHVLDMNEIVTSERWMEKKQTFANINTISQLI